MTCTSRPLRTRTRSLSCIALTVCALYSLSAQATPVVYNSGLLSGTSGILVGSQPKLDDFKVSTTPTQPDPLTVRNALTQNGNSAKANGSASQSLLKLRVQAQDKTDSAQADAGATFLGNFELQAGQRVSLAIDVNLDAFTLGAGQTTGDLAVSLNFDNLSILDQTFDHSGIYHWTFEAMDPVTATLGLTLSGHADSFGLGQAIQQGSVSFSVDVPAVPEPASAALLLAGMVGIGWHGQWRRLRAQRASKSTQTA